MVFDVSDAKGTPLSRFLRIRHPNDDGARLFTVALSRAQFNLVVLADFAYLDEKASQFAFVRKLLAYLRKNGTPIVLPSRSLVGV